MKEENTIYKKLIASTGFYEDKLLFDAARCKGDMKKKPSSAK